MEELKDPAKRQVTVASKKEIHGEAEGLDVDEADYVPQAGAASSLVDNAGSELAPQREVILKEITAFRERSNRRERNKSWYEDEDKSAKPRDESPAQVDHRHREKSQDRDEQKATRAGSVETIPSGPAADRRRPRDYHQSVKFRSGSDRYERDEEENVPDEELERRRLERKRRDLETVFIDVCTITIFF
jgi:hypothetical protein